MNYSSDALEIFDQALAYQNAGMLEEATARYLQVLALAPRFGEVYCNLGVIQKQQGKLQEAAGSFRRATELKPDFAQMWFNLGKVLGDLRELSESAGAYREALRLDPSYVAAHTNLGYVLDQLHCPEEALRHYNAAASLAPHDAQTIHNLAIAQAKQGRAEEAMDFYDRLVVANPQHAPAHNSRAFLREATAGRALLAEGHTRDKLRQLMDDAHSFAERTRDYFAIPGSLACQKGCAWCCHLQVTVLAAEVFRIAEFLRENRSEDELTKLRARLADVVQQTAGMDVQERVLSRVPCALLVDNACSVYPVRPLVCRGCASTNAAACEEATRRPGVAVENNPTHRAIHDGTSAGLFTALAEAGLSVEKYDLCSALLIALDNPDTVDRWLAKEPVLEPALWKESPPNPGRLSLL